MRAHFITRLAALLLMLASAGFALAPTAGAQMGITSFDGFASDGQGGVATQAASHPFDVSVAFEFTTREHQVWGPVPSAEVRDVVVELPVGFVGNPTAMPTCDQREFQLEACETDTQVGFIWFRAAPAEGWVLPVFNLRPRPGTPAQFGFSLLGIPVTMTASLRPPPNQGLTITVPDIPQTLSIYGTTVTFWGVPGDPDHDPLRGAQCYPNPDPANCSNGGRSFNSSVKPFLTLPANCEAGPLPTRLRVTSWDDAGTAEASFMSNDGRGSLIGVNGCDRLPFEPSIKADAHLAESPGPAGLDVSVSMGQTTNPAGVDTPPLRNAVVELPENVVVSPSSAAGLQGCSAELVGLNDNEPARCPEASKVGSVSITTPLLSSPLEGDVFVAQPVPGQLIALYFVVSGHGVTIKLHGRVNLDPVTGRVQVVLTDTPQLPFSRFDVRMKGGPRAPVAVHGRCAGSEITASFTPWSTSTVSAVSGAFSSQAKSNCGQRSFAPGFQAGMSSGAAGESGTFSVGFTRSDTDDELGGITLDMPPGLLAKLSSPTLCNDAAAAAGTCGEASRIGSVTTAAGAGSNPLSLPGRVYITGPYKGAPFGMSIVVPAVAGPFDLGTVVVRAAIFVDPVTTQLRVVSDPLPTILEGIPLQIRLVDVKVDRPGFMVNPTSCVGRSVNGSIASTLGAIANVATRFRASDCAALPFRPRMRIRAGSRRHTREGVSTPLAVTLSMPQSNANNRSVEVVLPKTLSARLEVLSTRNACTLEQYKSQRCPINVGSAVAVSPLLRDPLVGQVYLVRNPARRLPDVMVALKGQGDARGLSIDVTGKVTIRNLRLTTTFDTIPDAPISMFRLRFVSGRNAPIAATQNLCSARARRGAIAEISFLAQSGKRVGVDQRIGMSGCSKRARQNRRAASRRGAKARRGNKGRRSVTNRR